MSRYFIVLLSLLISKFALAEPYQVFQENGKVGLKNEEGQILLPASFEALGWSDGSFSVIGQITGYKLGKEWGIINLKKEFITKAEYENLYYSGGDRIIAFKKMGPTTSYFGCLNLSGRVTVPFKYDGIKIQGLRAIVFIKNGVEYRHGLIDLDDKEIIPLNFRSINAIGSLRYAVENFESKTALFTEHGVKLTGFEIDSISSFRKGKAIIYQNLRQGMIDREGEIKIEPQYREIKIDDEGLISTKSFDEWKILDGENHELRKIAADELDPITKGLYIISVSKKLGVMDEGFTSIIYPEFDELRNFYYGKLIAKKNGKNGLIRINGTEVLPFQFDSLEWDGQFIRAKENDKNSFSNYGQKGWNLYDTFGIKKNPRSYQYLGAYNGKFFPVLNKGFRGAINRFGEEFIHCVYDSIFEYKNDQLAVKYQGQYGIINLKEDWLLPPQHFKVKLINEEKYLEIHPSMIFVKNFSGEIIYFTDNNFELKAECLIEYLPDGTEKMVSLNGQTISRTQEPNDVSEEIFIPSEGLQGIKRDGLFGFVDARGRLRIANRYEAIGQFKEQLAPVKILGKWGFVNPEDNIAINPSYESAQEFEEGLAIVKRNGKIGIIDKDDKTILSTRYDSVARLEGKMFLLVSQNKCGLADQNGNVLIEPRFDNIENLQNGYVLVQQGGKFGLLTKEGLSTIPLSYDKLIYDKEKNQYLAVGKAEWLNFTK
jgi:hypothetical protein